MVADLLFYLPMSWILFYFSRYIDYYLLTNNIKIITVTKDIQWGSYQEHSTPQHLFAEVELHLWQVVCTE